MTTMWRKGLIVLAMSLGLSATTAAATTAATASAAPEADRRAILAMAGTYRVKFDFREKVAFVPGYTPLPAKVTGGEEVVRVVVDTGDTIVLQHLLVVGDAGKPVVIKHWRQDWAWQPTRVLTYRGPSRWVMAPVAAADAAGAWSQTVWQTDDSPRYGGVGRWTTADGVTSWTSAPTWRPLARRDATRHPVYDRYYGVNRHALTPTGWVHEQDNAKLAMKDGKLVTIVDETVVNSYDRAADFAVAAADDYWRKTAGYWAGVRSAWAARLAGGGILTVAEVAETGSATGERLMGWADDIAAGTSTEAAALGQASTLIDGLGTGLAAFAGPAATLSGSAALAGPAAFVGRAAAYDVVEKSIPELAADLAAGRTTSAELVRLYAARIAALDPQLHAVVALNPDAPAAAQGADAARRAGRAGGPLAGIPVLLKDNIESRDRLATTAGSLALAENIGGRDAPLVARLRAAGAIVLGKTNLSEWANIRSSHAISGWSAIGGQTRNPYALDRNPCGSSAGSGVAAAASLAAAAIGTETDGSVTCPAAVNGLVGMKPTVGLVSRTYVVPISHSQDTPGPMARSVGDAALLLGAMAGRDPADPATASADASPRDFIGALRPDALAGVRVGVMRFAAGFDPATDAVFEASLAVLRAAGATLVDIAHFPGDADLGKLEQVVLMTELKADLDAYLASTSARVASRSLTDLIAFDRAHAAQEMPLFGQDLFETAEATRGLADPAYLGAKADAHRLAGPEGIDRMLADNRVAVLVAPTLGPAWLIDPVLKDHFVGSDTGQAAAVAGYPHLTVPMGQVAGLPVGLSFVGAAWSDRALLAYGYAFEQASRARRPPRYLPTAAVAGLVAANAGFR